MIDNAALLAEIQKTRQGFEGIQDLLNTLIVGRRLSSLPQEELISEIVRNYSEPYKTFDIVTSTAQTQSTEFPYKGGVLQIVATTNNDLGSYVNVRFNSPMAAPIKMYLGDRVVTPFRTLWIDWPAQSGITFTIAIAQEFDNVFRLDKNFSGNLGSVSSINSIPKLTVVPTGATEIAARSIVAAAGANPTVLYTVTAGKTLYLAYADIGLESASGSPFYGELRHTDGGGTLVKTLLQCIAGSTGTGDGRASRSYLPTMAIPAGHKIEMNMRTAADASVTAPYRGACLYGWEI